VRRIPETITNGIRDTENFVLVTHVHPDGDALGSLLGLAEILDSLGKKVFCFLEEPVPQLYAFLPGCDRVETELSVLHAFVQAANGNVIGIALDCGDDNRLGKYKEELLAITPFVVIDHHKSHKDYGEYRWVEPGRSSTGEMVYELAMALGVNISYNCAFDLYVAICTDTGSFRYDSTHARTLQIAGELVAIGVKPAEISCHIYDNYSISRLKLLEMVLATMALYASDQIACIHVSQEMLRQCGTDLQDVEGFIEYPRSLRTAKVAVFIKEGPQSKISVSLRAKGECDVAEIAKLFNGGGHRNAAGFRFNGKDLEQVRSEVLDVLGRDLERESGKGIQ
jgi:bifunctional oligoribonuclease and PAP phosphatase NrnA